MSELVIACPTCAQKYRVSAEREGHRAQCKKCGQKFLIQKDQPIDDDTILGWVMDDNTADHSVLGSTSIFNGAGSSVEPFKRPTLSRWRPIDPPEKPRITFDHVDDKGAHFYFSARELRYPDIRSSFPLRCVHCLTAQDLTVHLVIWGDKLPHKDPFHIEELRTKAQGRLDQMLRAHKDRWFDQLEPMLVLPPPFCNPFPYFVCHKCESVGEVDTEVFNREGQDICRMIIPNIEIALMFYANNGGKGTPGYKLISDSSMRQQDEKWRRLATPVRNRIAHWYKPRNGEHFLAYFRDTDFSRAETGVSGLVVTDRRLIYKKYSTLRQFDINEGGELDIKADRRDAEIHIIQKGQREATLKSNPIAASHLAKALSKMSHPWKVKVATKPPPAQ